MSYGLVHQLFTVRYVVGGFWWRLTCSVANWMALAAVHIGISAFNDRKLRAAFQRAEHQTPLQATAGPSGSSGYVMSQGADKEQCEGFPGFWSEAGSQLGQAAVEGSAGGAYDSGVGPSLAMTT